MNPSAPSTHYRICPLCEACCGLAVTVDAAAPGGPKVLSIKGEAADPFSKGYICPKAVALKDLHEDPARLRTPMMRRRGKASPLEPCTWDEAFAEIARRLPAIQTEHGRDSVAVTLGNPAAHKFGLLLYIPRLAKALGTKSIYSASTLDQMPRQLANGLMYGSWLSNAAPDIERCQWLMVIGANPAVSNGSMWTVPDFRGKAKALRARGGKLVVVDPRRTETADLADAHHAIRPGGDVFLLAAMAQVLFDQGLVRTGRLGPLLADGALDALRRAVAPFTPEAASAHCGLAATTIVQLARDLASASAGCVYGRIGTQAQRYGTVNAWLVDVLNILTGHLDAPGGAMFATAPAFAANTAGKPGVGGGIATGRHRSRVSGAPEVWGEFPITLLAEEMLTPGAGQVRALFTIASNPVLSAPQGERIAQAMAGLDLMVSVDIYLSETAALADVVLPGQSPLEHSHYDTAFPQLSHRNHARYSGVVIPPAPSHLPEWQVLLKLAAIAKGDGAQADPVALDDAIARADVQRAAGAQADAVWQALGDLTGPERALELSLRSGPFGDGFGSRAGPQHPGPQLTLAKMAAAPAGIDLGPLVPRLPEALRTPSGRIELAPQLLLDDLAHAAAQLAATRASVPTSSPVATPTSVHTSAQASPAAAGRFTLIGRRDVRSNNSWMHNLPTLAKGPERCTVQMHPADAAAAGLADGQTAQLHNAHGRVSAPVEITDRMARGVVCLPHGWGHDRPSTHLPLAAQRPGANLNALLPAGARDPLSGNAVLSGVAVNVQPISA